MERKVLLVGAGLGALAFLLGVIVGYFSHGEARCGGVVEEGEEWGEERVTEEIIREISGDHIHSYLRNLTSKPHLAGTPADLEQAQWVAQLWREFGLEGVEVKGYDVLLSYPDKDHPNKVSLVTATSTTFTTALEEPPLAPNTSFGPDVVPPFNAYSAPGTAKGDLLYVNYCRKKDFDHVKELGIDIEGKIIICRYGKIFRGDKVDNAAALGCLGVILFGDPGDYALDGVEHVYPDTWWLPGSGVQRGTVKMGIKSTGDPLTPGYPANEYAFRLSEEEANVPRIPVHPINYNDARRLLKNLAGPTSPTDWHGNLAGVEYRIGPGFSSPEPSGTQVEIDVHTSNKLVTTYNVVGSIRGSIEPDRYVILGNHRDAWVFGSVDPSSGTAAMLEMTRMFGKMKDSGYRPRRTILFCSWGAEEYGLVGSTEFVEEYQKLLKDRAVAYINVDIAVQGNFSIRALAAPSLHQVLFNAAKKIPNPNPEQVNIGRKTVFDTWVKSFPSSDQTAIEPEVHLPGTASDYKTFAFDAGIPSADVRYTFDKNLWPISSYPLYHSAYETLHYVETMLDPTFKYHEALSKLWAQLGHDLASSTLIPLDLRDYVKEVEGSLKSLQDGYGEILHQRGIELGSLKSAVENFTRNIENFHKQISETDLSNTLQVRIINDQILQFERAFLDCHGLPGRPYDKHILFAPSIYDSYSGSSFPGLVDAMHHIETLPEPEASRQWSVVKQQLAVLTFIIQAAGETLVEKIF